MDRAMKITKRQCQLAFFSAAVVVICVCVGVTMNLTTLADENFDHSEYEAELRKLNVVFKEEEVPEPEEVVDTTADDVADSVINGEA